MSKTERIYRLNRMLQNRRAISRRERQAAGAIECQGRSGGEVAEEGVIAL